MNAYERAGQFLRQLVNSPKVSVDVHGSENVGNGRFVRSLKTLVPAMVASAATYALTSTPQAEMRINHEPPVALRSMEQVLDRATDPQTVDLYQMKTIVKCLYDQVLDREADNDEFKPTVRLMLSVMNASAENNSEIEAWSSETGRDPAEAVAALCENPSDWKGQLQAWDVATEKQNVLRPETWMRVATERAYADFSARTHAVYRVADDVVNVQQQHGARAMKVSDFSTQRWFNAATAVVNGGAVFFGRDHERSARDLTNTARQGERRLRQGQSIIRSNNPVDQLRNIGNLMGNIGHDFQRHNQRQEMEVQRAERQRQNEIRRHELEMQRLDRQAQRGVQRSRYR